ncbi:hypothetical protein J4558_07250 [Leptolyngbya sp. 15MV]|nr:hypothetical protein J4558_07250 [Leptolyngbya sp. 15MV]
MARSIGKTGFGRFAPALFAVATLGVPSAGLALVGLGDAMPAIGGAKMVPFTPASVDPELARRVQERIAARGKALRFTPAGSIGTGESTVTVAVRVDDQTARAISVRSTLANLQAEPGTGRAATTLAGTRYNLGLARGYQSFAKPQASPATVGLRDIAMPDLADFKPSESRAERPSRFQPRVALESEIQRGRSRGTLEGLGEQTVDLGGAYRVTRNLDVTAGVRLSQDRDRIAPLGEAVEDSQAVYVGTQFRF